MKRRRNLPSYRHHKPSNQAVVTLCGRDFYLGPWKSQVSRDEYDRLVSEWLANSRQLPTTISQSEKSVVQLIAAYWEFATGYYVKNGQLTGQIPAIKVALRLLKEKYGWTPASEFGPLSLLALQEHLIGRNLARRYINDLCAIVKRLFKWAASRELVPVSVYQALATVPGLRKGRSAARECEPRGPVADEDFEKTLPELSNVVGAMVCLQRVTGCRPGEVRIVRPADIDRSDDTWCYVPSSHKTEHRDRQRRVYLGPKAQEIVAPWLLRPAAAYCFNPQESCRRQDQRRGDHYTKDAYRRAVSRACQRAGVASWSPNQLRHSLATEVRKQYGLEAVQSVLGHANASVSEIYAQRDFNLAKDIMRKLG